MKLNKNKRYLKFTCISLVMLLALIICFFKALRIFQTEISVDVFLDMNIVENRRLIESVFNLVFPDDVVWIKSQYESSQDAYFRGKFYTSKESIQLMSDPFNIKWSDTIRYVRNDETEWFDPDSIIEFKSTQFMITETRTCVKILYDNSTKFKNTPETLVYIQCFTF
jgi:hypothetical protein